MKTVCLERSAGYVVHFVIAFIRKCTGRGQDQGNRKNVNVCGPDVANFTGAVMAAFTVHQNAASYTAKKKRHREKKPYQQGFL
jgi:hypothetical protein